MRTIHPQGAYFNRFLSLGYSVASMLEDTEAHTLGLIISECAYGIGDPFFNFLNLPFFKELNLEISIVDSGCLLHAETSKEHGTTIVLADVPWLTPYREGIELSLKWLLAASFRNFLNETDMVHKWIYPINVVGEEWLKSRYPQIHSEEVQYRESWISRESLNKYRLMLDELQARDDSQFYQDQITQLIKICSKSTAFHKHLADKTVPLIDEEFPVYLNLVESILGSAHQVQPKNPLRIL